MPRPRFEKLDPDRRAAILAVAAQEFAEHGFEASSYNRIIERSGLSKGAIYYYFDDKEDLYTTVLKDALQRVSFDFAEITAATDPASFWLGLEAYSRRSLRTLQADPHATGLARSLLKALARGAAGGVIAELRLFLRSSYESFLQLGQALGAVRADVPFELFIRILIALEEAIDLWLGDRIAEMTPPEIDATAAMLTDLYRRIAEPVPARAPAINEGPSVSERTPRQK